MHAMPNGPHAAVVPHRVVVPVVRAQSVRQVAVAQATVVVQAVAVNAHHLARHSVARRPERRARVHALVAAAREVANRRWSRRSFSVKIVATEQRLRALAAPAFQQQEGFLLGECVFTAS